MKYSQSTEKKRGRAVDGARAMTDSVLMAFLETPEQSTPQAQEADHQPTDTRTNKN